MKSCPPNKIYNPKSKRCVLLSGKIGKKILEDALIKKRKKKKRKRSRNKKKRNKKKKNVHHIKFIIQKQNVV